jgi:hypothetical protein
MSAVSKRISWLSIAAALVIGGVIGFVWHAPGRPSTWGDIRTWLTFAAVAIGVPAAIIQLDLQRRQLRSQQEVIAADAERRKDRDTLLEGQLRELEQRTIVAERAQAEQVEFSWRSSVPLEGREDVGQIWMGVVQNASQRPIRDVVCRIQPHPAQGFDFGALGVGQLESAGIGSAAQMPVFTGAMLGDRVPLIRVGQTWGFKTEIRFADHGVARMKVRLTDDAGLHWEIDPDLHLMKLQERNW